jgi:uncharacterized membrane protein
MMNWYDDGWAGGGWVVMGLMALFWIVLLGVAIGAGVHLLRRDTTTPTTTPTTTSTTTPTTLPPRAILDQRLAAGEIDAEHYAQLRRLIEGHTADPTSADTSARP